MGAFGLLVNLEDFAVGKKNEFGSVLTFYYLSTTYSTPFRV